MGARPFKDGMDGVHVHVTNSSNLPIECLEMEYPLLMERCELRIDSGGPGKYRGGLGIRRDYRILQEMEFASHADRQKIPPWGLFGGMSGDGGRFVIDPGSPQEQVLKSGKVSEVLLKPGQVLSAQSPGSGGYGLPTERDPQLVLMDVLEEKVSPQVARDVYKVVIDIYNRRIDHEATEKLRQL